MGMPRTFLMSILFATVLFELATATNYVVGGLNGGWDLTTDQTTWASSQTFLAGDNLIFQYSPGHDVSEVTKADYDSCQVTSPIQTYTSGATVIPLASPGKRYFVCSSPGHCAAGMKLQVNTLTASSTPSPSPSPAILPPLGPVAAPSPATVVGPVLPESPATLPPLGPVSPPSPATVVGPVLPESPATLPPLGPVSTPSPATVVGPVSPPAPEASSPLTMPSSKSTPVSSPEVLITPPSHVSAESASSSAKKGSFPTTLVVGLSFFSALVIAQKAS